MTISDKRVTVTFRGITNEDVLSIVNDLECAGFNYDELKVERDSGR